MSTQPTGTEPNQLEAEAAAFRRAVTQTLDEPPPVESAVAALLTEHFGGVSPVTLPAVSEGYYIFLMVNFQVALDEFLGEPGRTHRTVGVHCPSWEPTMHDAGGSITMSRLLSKPSFTWVAPVIGPADFRLRPCGYDEMMPCLHQGLVLFRDADGPGAIWVRGILGGHFLVDVMHPSREHATQLSQRLRARGTALSPFRGRLIEIIREDLRPSLAFLPPVDETEATDVILPAGLLEAVEGHSLDIIRAHHALEASRSHFKRGLLLHGKPGTGKTHTIRYLVNQLPDDTTVLVLSGSRMAGWHDFKPIPFINTVIDLVEPGVVIFDDCDLIAENRDQPGKVGGGREDLFDLLELLDGIHDDADLLFILTTNRPNLIEPAVAARPGRIDQAVEIPLPDADCRRRLLELYTRHLTFEAADDEIDAFITRTEGVTASFVREAVRRTATSHALDHPDVEGLRVSGAELLASLDQMLEPDHPLVSVLLGGEKQTVRRLRAQIVQADDQS